MSDEDPPQPPSVELTGMFSGGLIAKSIKVAMFQFAGYTTPEGKRGALPPKFGISLTLRHDGGEQIWILHPKDAGAIAAKLLDTAAKIAAVEEASESS